MQQFQPVLAVRSDALSVAGISFLMAMAIWGIYLLIMMLGFFGLFMVVTMLGGNMLKMGGLLLSDILLMFGPLGLALVGSVGASSVLTRRHYARAVFCGYAGALLSLIWILLVMLLSRGVFEGFVQIGAAASVLFTIGLAIARSRRTEFLDQAPPPSAMPFN